MPKVGGRRKKAKSHKQTIQEEEQLLPRTFVFKIGKSSQECRQVAKDLRRCFYPHTALKLEDSNRLGLRSYLKAAKYYSVTHLLALQQRNQKTHFRIIKVDGGEMRFKEVLKDGGQPFSIAFKQALLVLNNFSQTSQTERIGRALQQLFPPINLEKIRANHLKRVISFTYQANKKCIYFRHYKIIMGEGGVSCGFKQLLHPKKDTDLSSYRTFMEFLNQQEQVYGEENQQTVKLLEMGPRLKLKFTGYYENNGKVPQQEYQQQQEQINNQQINQEQQQN